MARAMRASGDLIPTTIRAISLTFVFPDSMAVREIVLGCGEDRGTMLDDAFLELHERSDPRPTRPGHPFVERVAGLFVR